MKLHMLPVSEVGALVHSAYIHGENLLQDHLASRRLIGENFKILANKLDKAVGDAAPNMNAALAIISMDDLAELLMASLIPAVESGLALSESERNLATTKTTNEYLRGELTKLQNFEDKVKMRLSLYGSDNEKVVDEIETLVNFFDKTKAKAKKAKQVVPTGAKKSAKKRK